MYENGKVDSLKGQTLAKIRIMPKISPNKNYQGFNFLQKTRCAPPGEEPGGSEDCHFRNIIMYENGKLDSLQGLYCQKYASY